MSQKFKIVYTVVADNGDTTLIPPMQVMVEASGQGLDLAGPARQEWRDALVGAACEVIRKHIIATLPPVDVQIGPK